jgi:hypothetical protein
VTLEYAKTTAPRLTRRQSAQFLTAQGFPIEPRHFEKLCCPGSAKGPRVDLWFGGRALYRPEDLLAWAEGRSLPGDECKKGR